MKSIFCIFLILIASTLALQAQIPQLEWESETEGFYYYCGDMENDGILEIIYLETPTSSEIKILDGSTHLLKYTLPYDGQNNLFTIFLPGVPDYNFCLDWNGDGVKDLLKYSYNTSFGNITLLDVNNNNIIWQLDDPNYVLQPGYLGDFDNDNVVELLILKQDPNNWDFQQLLIYSTGLFSSSINETPQISSTYNLEQNFPNPFNPSTTIKYSISSAKDVAIKLFDVSGRLIKQIIKQHSQPGEYEVNWDGTNNSGERVASGIYFYQLLGNNFTETKKMILLK